MIETELSSFEYYKTESLIYLGTKCGGVVVNTLSSYSGCLTFKYPSRNWLFWL